MKTNGKFDLDNFADDKAGLENMKCLINEFPIKLTVENEGEKISVRTSDGGEHFYIEIHAQDGASYSGFDKLDFSRYSVTFKSGRASSKSYCEVIDKKDILPNRKLGFLLYTQ